MKTQQRQAATRSARVAEEPGRARQSQGNQRRERVREVKRRPKKYFVAKRLLEPEVTLTRLAAPPRARRPKVSTSRAPAGTAHERVTDVMVTEVVTIAASATLLDAARRMRDANVGMLPVVDDGRLRGVITDRDLVVRAMAEGIAPGTVRVDECFTERVIAARPEWSTDQAMQTMALEQVGRLPVTEDGDRLLGVVTLGSLALRSREREETLETAQEVSRRSSRRRR